MTIVPIPGESLESYIHRARRMAQMFQIRDETHSTTNARRTTMPTENGGENLVRLDFPPGAEPDEIAVAFQRFRAKKLAEKKAKEEAERKECEGTSAPLGEP
jgi:hypothetical protein